MHRSLEIMKEMVRRGGPPERDPIETWAPLIALGIVGAALAVALVLRLLAWLS